MSTGTHQQPRHHRSRRASLTLPSPHPLSAYRRVGNPTRDAFERCMAKMEGGNDALAFATGMAAASAILQAAPQYV